MQPRYITVSSSGSSPWQVTNWNGYSPMNIGFAALVTALTSQYQLDVTMDSVGPNFPSSAGPTIFLSSRAAGGGLPLSSANAIGVITQPIAAWRVTNNSTGGTVTVTVLEQGVG